MPFALLRKRLPGISLTKDFLKRYTFVLILEEAIVGERDVFSRLPRGFGARHLTLVRVPFTGRVPVQMVYLSISDIQWKTTPPYFGKSRGAPRRRIGASSTPETINETHRLTAANHNGRSSSGLLILVSSRH